MSLFDIAIVSLVFNNFNMLSTNNTSYLISRDIYSVVVVFFRFKFRRICDLLYYL